VIIRNKAKAESEAAKWTQRKGQLYLAKPCEGGFSVEIDRPAGPPSQVDATSGLNAFALAALLALNSHSW
jgi:hypothetical protein